MAEHDDVETGLRRIRSALAAVESAAGSSPAASPPDGSAKPAARTRTGTGPQGAVLAAIGLMMLGFGLVAGHPGLVTAALALLAVAGVLAMPALQNALGALTGVGPKDPARARIGMGATIDSSARIEPGARVEMGADVGAGAVIKKGAVVRMGASIHARVVLEEGAVVSWGADVHEGAVIGADAVVGAGSEVGRGARVPPGMRVAPGSDWVQGKNSTDPEASAAERARSEAAAAALAAAPADPRDARIDASCNQIESDFAQASPQVRQALGTSAATVRALRATAHELAARERSLRKEASAETLAWLDREKAALEERIGRTTDAVARASLQSAVAAIADQRRQREQLQQAADRLDAELTRLVWTLDGLAAQLVRLRSAGDEAARAPDAGLQQSVQRLRDEIDAIADALEQVNAPRPSLADHAVSPPDAGAVDDASERADAQARKTRPKQ